jgi:hypothetical protein
MNTHVLTAILIAPFGISFLFLLCGLLTAIFIKRQHANWWFVLTVIMATGIYVALWIN